MIRSVNSDDAQTWKALREELWPSIPGDDSGDHALDIARYFAGDRREPAEVLLAVDDMGYVLGFAELSIRNIADSCYTDRVAYLEGWYVRDAARGRGVGAELVRAAEDWGRAQGCTEFASDAEVDNERSIAIHKQLGFTEVARVVCFRKNLTSF